MYKVKRFVLQILILLFTFMPLSSILVHAKNSSPPINQPTVSKIKQDMQRNIEKEIIGASQRNVDRAINILKLVSTFIGILVSLIAILLTLAGVFGFFEYRRWKEIRKQAEEYKNEAKKCAEEARPIIEGLKKYAEETEEMKKKFQITGLQEKMSDENKKELSEIAERIKWLEILGTPLKAEDYFRKGLDFYNRKEYELSIISYDKAIKLDSTGECGTGQKGAAYNNRGNAYSDKKEYDKAIEDYNKAIELDPKYASAYYNRGNAYYKKGLYDKAINDYTMAIELNPKDVVAYNSRGWRYLWLGEWEKAKQDLEKAIELDAKNPLPYGNLGIYYWKAKNDKQKALEYYEKCFQLGFDKWDELYDDKSDGHFISDLNLTTEFKALVEKYKKGK